MPVEPADVLERMAATLRMQVGPAVEDPFAKTQAFMAAVILAKLAGQLRGEQQDARAGDEERGALVTDMRAALGETSSTRVADALTELAGDGRDASWNVLVHALYADRDEFGAERFAQLLDRLRVAMRARLDRMLVYAA